MENFFYGDRFYSDLGELMDNFDINEECDNIPDDWSIECKESDLEPIFRLSPDWILERIDEERLTEDGNELDKIEKVLQTIDYETINSKIPSLYYESRRRFTITKADLIEWCK